jgi:PAS domain S-box-containing protein
MMLIEEEKYRAIVEHMASCICLLDIDTRRIVEFNAAFQNLLEYQREEILGQTFFNFIVGDHETLSLHIQHALARKHTRVEEHQCRRRNGSIIDIEITINPVIYSEKEVLGIVVRDITQHKRTEAMLKEKNEELEKALQQLKETQNQLVTQEKLASLGGLTAGIAHEIKNPLNFINNFAELSTELTNELTAHLSNQKGRLEPDVWEEIQDILRNLEGNMNKVKEHGRRADSIMRSMLLHSRKKAGERQPTEVNTLLAEYINLAYHGMRAKDSAFNMIIRTDYDSSVGMVYMVPQDVGRVFLNIIDNACYALNEKRKQQGETFSPTLWASTKMADRGVEIRLRDNGNGIPQKVLDKIFNPFFTTKPAGEGTGLGLSLSYNIIVQDHKGELKVETEEGNYTEFIILLPKRAADRQRQDSSKPSFFTV